MNTSGAAPEWTYSEYARLPDDGNRYEVIDGEVCATPSSGPTHQRVAANLFMVLQEYVRVHGLGEMLWDLDLLFVSGQFLRPNMLFVPTEAAGGVTDRGMQETPGLVVEVLSPHSRRIDRIKKPPRYRDFGVPEYWVVDPAARAIERYRLAADAAPEICTAELVWQPDPGKPPLRLEVARIFPAG
ncbi:MAG TPA: Uma2 family endonuclease [Longimicrobiales bacterium]|nr:Uma2 family endonuclease [Longimicrobiales bacterium]